MINSQSQVITNNAQAQAFKILLIARSNKLVKLLKLELSHEGYELEVVHDSLSGLLRCEQFKPQLIILDWHISCFFAADLCSRFRSIYNPISIFVVDSERQVEDRFGEAPSVGSISSSKLDQDIKNSARAKYRVAALDAGADDCISFPFVMSEFLARIRVQLRKYMVKSSSILMFEDLKLNSLTREVYRGDRYIYLTTTEFALLKYLLTYPRQVLTRAQILDFVWGYDYMKDSNIIEVYIRYLRLKLEKNNGKRLIYTVRNVGYVIRESDFRIANSSY